MSGSISAFFLISVPLPPSTRPDTLDQPRDETGARFDLAAFDELVRSMGLCYRPRAADDSGKTSLLKLPGFLALGHRDARIVRAAEHGRKTLRRPVGFAAQRGHLGQLLDRDARLRPFGGQS